jgi:hypothetical protein
MADEAGQRLERAGVTGALVFAARERLAMKVGKPTQPLALPTCSPLMTGQERGACRE